VEDPGHATAVALLTNTVRTSSTPIKLLALGPLTNVAEALESDPALAQKLHSLTIMGGAVDVPGNVGSSSDIRNEVAEWNIYIDPSGCGCF
jgi:inosine-uridine nucleoside N-ribohydrolase